MSLKEIASSFAIGALLAALAIGAYLWIGAAGGHTVEAGSFTEVDGGALIGAEADAVDGPVDVEVEWVDPSGEEAFAYHEAQIEDAGEALELRAEQTPDGAELLTSEPGASFLVGLPVPDRFDEDRLVGMIYQHGDFVGGHFAEGVDEVPDAWAYEGGVLDPQEDVFLMTVPTIGGDEHPTRILLVEHSIFPTTAVEGALDAAIEGSNAAKDGGTATAQLATFSSATAQPRDHQEIQLFPDDDSKTERYLATPGLTGADGFMIECYVDRCHESPDRVVAGHTIRERWDELESSLQASTSVYEDLEGNQGPRLEVVGGLLFPHEAYEWRLHGPYQDSTLFGGEEEAWSHSYCEAFGGGGWYDYANEYAATCLNSPALMRLDGEVVDGLTFSGITAAHELFHAYQNGFTDATDREGWIAESTSALAMEWEDPLGMAQLWYPPEVTTTARHETRPEYRMESFFHHLFETNSLGFEDMGRMFQEGLELDHADRFVEWETQLDGVGEAYWAFAKDLVYEDGGPEIRPPENDEGSCELYRAAVAPPEAPDAVAPPGPPPPLDVEARTVQIDHETLDVAVGEDEDVVSASLDPLTSDVYELDVELGASVDQALWLRVTLETPDSDDPDLYTKVYKGEEEGTEDCWSDDREVTEAGNSAGIEVWDGTEEATLLVANGELDRAATYRLVFEACPMWTQEGQNGGRTYEVGSCGDPSAPATPVQTMSATPGREGAIQLQDEDEPGSLLWSASSDGTSRPSAGYGKIYTSAGVGSLQGMMQGQPGTGFEMPDGVVNAYDAETGDRVWQADDSSTQLNIGTGMIGSGFMAGMANPTSLSPEVLLGGGNVYVPGGQMDAFYPPGEDPGAGTEAPYGGVLAFDAEDGSLAWEAQPPASDPPHEAAWIDKIAVQKGSIYAKGGTAWYVDESGPYHDEPQWVTESEQNLWAFDAATGSAHETWSSDLDRTAMTMGDGDAIVAGWTIPDDEDEPVESRIQAIDPATGSAQWAHEDPFHPPPDDELDTYTASISQIVHEDDTAYVGTMIVTENDGPAGNELTGAVYAFGPDGQRWRQTMDEPMPSPAVRDGTLYAMTGLGDPAGDGDGGSGFSDAEASSESTLHAVDASVNETRWAVNASITMTVTEDRVYVGKVATPDDPLGASVAALNTTTGETVWVNEEDVNGPMALTGAYVDGVLYVNTQASVVALHG